MNSRLSHIQINIRPEHLSFYKDLFALLNWQPVFENDEMLAVADASGHSLWFIGHAKDVQNDYDGPGMNHLGISVDAQADVDATAEFLTKRGVELLFETPRHRAEFSQNEDQTYYQVMFETPDRVLLEVVYTGPKSA